MRTLVHRRLGLRATGAALVTMLAAFWAAGPAGAGSGIAVVPVPVGSPTTRAVSYHWGPGDYGWFGNPDPGAGVIPGGVSSVRFPMPSAVASLGVDPAGVQLTAVANGQPGMCPVDTDGLAMDGWVLVVDPGVLTASALGTCVAADPQINGMTVQLKGQTGGVSLDLGIDVRFVPSQPTAPIEVTLGNFLKPYETDTYALAPANAGAGVVLEIGATPGFFDQSSFAATVSDVNGAVAATVGWPDAVVSSDGSLVTVPLPSDLPASAAVVRLDFVTRKPVLTGQPVGERMVIELAPISDPVYAYVTAVYLNLLHRTPDVTGATNWSAALRGGTPYQAVANGITASDEFRLGMITASYEEYLGRSPDSVGLRNWLAAMAGGLTIEAMQAGFVASSEYYTHVGGTDAAWVTHLYSEVLHRAASTAELVAWEQTLAVGASRYQVALGFLLSTEHLTTVVDGYYLDLLHRRIDPAGGAAWVTLIQGGYRDEQIIAGVVASPEYRSKVPIA